MSLVNTRGLQLDCAMVLQEALLVPVLLYTSKTIISRENEGSRFRAIQMKNLRGLLGIRRMDKVPNTWIEVGGVTKEMDENIDEIVH